MLFKKLAKKDVLVISLFLLVFLAIIPLAKDSLGRFHILSLLLFLYLTIFLFSRNIFLTFSLFAFLVLPFNITYRIPIPVQQSMANNLIVNYLIPTISVLDLAVGIFLIATSFQEGFSFFGRIFQKYKVALLLFSLFLLVQNIFLRNPLVILNTVRFFTYTLSFILIVENLLSKKRVYTQRERVLFAMFLLFSVFVQGVIGIQQFLGGVSVGLGVLGESRVSTSMLGSSFISLKSGAFLRAYGTFPHPNILGGYLLLSLFISLFLLRVLKGRTKLFPIVTIILSSISIFFTFSRTVLILFVMVLAILFLSKVFFKKKSLAFLPTILLERFFQGFRNMDSSLIDRRNLIKSSYIVLKENLFLGTGLGNFVKEMGDNAPKTARGLSLMQPVHNIFLLLLCELGVFGFFSFFFLLFEVLRKSLRKVTLFGVLIFVVLVGIGLVDHYFFSLPQGLFIFFVFLSLLVVEGKTERVGFEPTV